MSSVESVSQTSRSSDAVFTTGPALYPLEGTRRCGGVCPTSLHVFCILAWFSLQIQVKIKHKRRHLTASYRGQCFGSMERLVKKCLQVLFLRVCCGGVFVVYSSWAFTTPERGSGKVSRPRATEKAWHKRMGMINGRVLNTEKNDIKRSEAKSVATRSKT